MIPIVPAPRPLCVLCERKHSRRRELCWTCYQKLRACNLALPACGKRGRRWPNGPSEPLALLVATLRRWPTETRARLLLALQEAEAL